MSWLDPAISIYDSRGIYREKYRKDEHGDPARGGQEGDDNNVSQTTSVSDSKDRTSADSGCETTLRCLFLRN